MGRHPLAASQDVAHGEELGVAERLLRGGAVVYNNNPSEAKVRHVHSCVGLVHASPRLHCEIEASGPSSTRVGLVGA